VNNWGLAPIIHTQRLLLVPLADRHLDLEVQLDSDPEVLRYLSGRAHTRDEVVENQPDDPGVADLGYRILRRYWRQGLATEASRALLRHAFLTVGVRRVIAQTMAVNAASRGVMTSVAMSYVRTYFPEWEDPSLALGRVRWSTS
jgi:RimJ/RimL family protein N-acetyltransferase